MTNKTWQKWSNDELNKLKEVWSSCTMKELNEYFPNRNYNSLVLKASQLGVKSKRNNRKRNGNFEFLDTLNEKSCYWWGFIIADGYLNDENLRIDLNIKDLNHLEILANHLKCYNKIKTHTQKTTFGNFEACYLSLGDKVFSKKWLSILNINSPKTYTPPDLSIFLTKDNLLPFMIGLIDGDGCIWKSKNWHNLRIELHFNWYSTLELLSNKLFEYYDIDSKVKITKKGTSKIEINTIKDLKILKNYIKNVDYMYRKWSKLDTLR